MSRRHSGDTNNTNGDTQNVKKEPIRQKGLDQQEITQGPSKKGKGLKRGHNILMESREETSTQYC